MGGKITNILIGISNIFIGVLIFVYEYVNISGAIEFSKYQNEVMKIFKYILFGYIVLNAIINFVYTFFNKMEPKLKKSYALFIPIIGYLIYPHFAWGIIGIIAGIVLIINIFRKNFVEADNNVSSSISGILILISIILGLCIFFNDQFAKSLKQRDQVGLKLYDENFFELVKPVENEDPKYRFKYINLKRGDKFGYINENGETLIDFKYDFATPFYLIEKNDQKYYVGAVTKGDITEVILKNERLIMSYKSEKEIYDYTARIEEFENILKEKIKPGIIQLEIPKSDNYYVYSPVYKEDSREERLKDSDTPEKVWTYRYDYTEKYDFLVTESNMGYDSKFELANKNDLNERIKLNAENIPYDKDKLYTLPGGYIPFFNPKEKVSGYFDINGKRKKLTGNAKILYVEKDRVLIKNEVKNSAYFIDKATGKEVSPSFKEIVVDTINSRYLVKNNNDKWMLLNKNLERVFQEEFDIAKTDLLKAGIYVFGNFPDEIEVNEYNYIKINYIFANNKMEVISKGVNFFYDSFDKFQKKNITQNDYEKFKQEVSGVKSNIILDKYYNLIFNKEKNQENVLSEIEKEKKIQGKNGNKDLSKEKIEEMKKAVDEKTKEENEEQKDPVAPNNDNNLAPQLPNLEN